MGIKEQGILYVSDRGEEFQVSDVRAQHLMNVIIHHEKQLEHVYQTEELCERRYKLQKAVDTLGAELSKRHPDNDNDYSDNPRSRHHY